MQELRDIAKISDNNEAVAAFCSSIGRQLQGNEGDMLHPLSSLNSGAYMALASEDQIKKCVGEADHNLAESICLYLSKVVRPNIENSDATNRELSLYFLQAEFLVGFHSLNSDRFKDVFLLNDKYLFKTFMSYIDKGLGPPDAMGFSEKAAFFEMLQDMGDMSYVDSLYSNNEVQGFLVDFDVDQVIDFNYLLNPDAVSGGEGFTAEEQKHLILRDNFASIGSIVDLQEIVVDKLNNSMVESSKICQENTKLIDLLQSLVQEKGAAGLFGRHNLFFNKSDAADKIKDFCETCKQNTPLYK
jgi:hypothetical protein